MKGKKKGLEDKRNEERGEGDRERSRTEERVEFLNSVIPEVNGVHILSSYMTQ